MSRVCSILALVLTAASPRVGTPELIPGAIDSAFSERCGFYTETQIIDRAGKRFWRVLVIFSLLLPFSDSLTKSLKILAANARTSMFMSL
jgi:hypothetical protein